MKSLKTSSPLQHVNHFSGYTSNTDHFRHFRITTLIVVIFLTLGTSSVLGMHPHVEFDEVAHSADVIFVGRVTDISTRLGNSIRMVFTDVTFENIHLIARQDHVPEKSSRKITLTFAGGRVGDIAVRVSGVPEFEIGQERLIFTRHDGQTYGNPVIGGDLGLFELITDETTGFKYPLAAGRAGIASVANGKLKKISRVKKVQNGIIQRGAKKNRMLTPPMSPDGRNYGVTATEPPPPAGMLTLVEFIGEIHNTLAAGVPGRSVLPIRSQGSAGPKIILDLPSETPEVLDENDSETGMVSNDLKNQDAESSISTLGGQMLWCGYQDIPIVMEQYPESWEPWYGINNNCMWQYNQVMNVYEITGSDGSFGRDNDESEFCGWVTDAQMNRVYGYHWNGALAMCITHIDTKNCTCCEITEADIMYNPEYSWWEHFEDVYNVNVSPLRVLYRPVTLHELGHSWGLQRPQSAETYDYDRLTVMHSYYNNIIEDGYGIHAVDAELMRDAYDPQTFIIGFHDMGVESYYAENGLHNSTTDKNLYEPGQTLTVQNISVENIAYSTQFDIRLRLYLSTDKNITTDDYLMGPHVNWASFSKESTWVGNLSRTIPNDVPTGSYYVGLILTVGGAAYDMDAYPANNITYLPYKVSISCPRPTGITGVTASDNVDTDKIRVTWTSHVGISSYEVWRHTSNFAPDAERIAHSLGGNMYDDTTAEPGQTYYYWVRGINFCGATGDFGGSDSGYRAVADLCRQPPDYDYLLIPAINWKSVPGDFGIAGCRVYRMYLYKHIGYDFSLCGNDNVGGVYTGDGDGDLAMYDPAGGQLWYIRGYTTCDRNATTIGHVAYQRWAPPADGYYYLKVSDYANDQFGSYYLAYRASIGDYCWSAPNANDTLVPAPYWQVSDEEQLIAGACRMYRISMSPDNSYDFSLCVNEGVGAFWEGGSEGNLFLYNSSGVQLWEIDPRSECGYNASTLGTIREGWSPPTEDDYYLRVIPYSQNSNANYRLAYRFCPNPDDPVTPAPDNEVSDIPLDTNLSWLGILDDFDRQSDHYMGRNWIERSGDFRISVGDARGSNNSLMTFNGVSGDHISVDAHKVPELGYVALVSGYADQDNCIFVKIQGSGDYSGVYFFFGANGQNNAAWSGQTMYTINKTFTSARISTHLEGDTVTLKIDTDFDGDTDQTFSRSGVPLHLLGDGIGLGVYGLDSIDNFALTGPATTTSSNSKGEVIDSSSFCYDLGHPTLAEFVADIGSSDRGIAVDFNETVEVSALAIKAVIGFKNNLTVKIRQVNSNLLGNFFGPILASATSPVSAGELDFHDVPIDFTFQKGLRYDISFNVTNGWGNSGDDQLEYYQFDNPTLNPTSGFDVGSFKVLDGRAKSYSDTKLPHIRICLAQPCPTTWDLYIGTENPPETIVANNLTGPFYDPTSIPNGMLNSCTTYYWRTVIKNCCGETEGPVWSFTTGDIPPFEPYPEDASVDVSAHSSLMWSSAAPDAPIDGGSSDPVEILRNPGFESGELSPWYTDAEGDWAISSQYLHSGDFYADSRDDSWIQQDFPPVAVVDIVSVTLWSRQPGKNRQTAVKFFYQDGTSNYVLESTSGTWRQFDVTSGLQANKILTGIRIWYYGADGIDDLTNIDDVSIMAKDIPCQTTYNVYMGTENPPQALIVSDLTEPSVDPTPEIGDMLRSCDTYYWQIEANNCCGQTLTSPVWSFRTDQLADLDGSRTVSLGDFAVFTSHWLDIDCTIPDWCNAADIDHSGSNDQFDLSLLVEQWLRTCP